jgi:catechol 2,3-dioxygenase
VPLPVTNQAPPFDVTRLSHVVLQVTDLGSSRAFYEEVIGLVVTESDSDTLYLRGVEERCHHSLVLRRATTSPPACERIGFRVAGEEDLDRGESFLTSRGFKATFAEVPNQGRTLRVSDAGRLALEFCAHMPTRSRQIAEFASHRGAAAARIDHVQAHVRDIVAAASFYAELGFRVSEYASADGTAETPFRSVFLARKGNANDIVLSANLGPRCHHTAFVVHDASTTLLKVCDLAAGRGGREQLEWGPNRHGLGYEQFLYLRDPDGHRVELLSHPYQLIDGDDEPFGWSTSDANVPNLWGPPAPESWFKVATPFDGIDPQPPDSGPHPAGAA